MQSTIALLLWQMSCGCSRGNTCAIILNASPTAKQWHRCLLRLLQQTPFLILEAPKLQIHESVVGYDTIWLSPEQMGPHQLQVQSQLVKLRLSHIANNIFHSL